MNTSFNEEKLYYNDAVIYVFESKIDKILKFKDKNVIVILLNPDHYKHDNKNVLCIDTKGNLLWQVPKYDYIYEDSPFVSILEDEGNVRLVNWDSSQVLIEPASGEILLSATDSRRGRRQW